MQPEVSDEEFLPPLSYSDILYASPRLDAQLVLLLLQSIIWFIIMNGIIYPIGLKLMQNMDAGKKEKLIKITQSMMEKMGIVINDDDLILSILAENYTVLVQHALSGLLCAPSTLGMVPTSTAHALARHGSLCELGWETESYLIVMYYIIFGGELGRKRYPPVTIFALTIHHSLSFLLAIPFNIYYPDMPEVHEMICLLQLAAVVALTMQFYGFLKDVKTYDGLLKMKISIIVSFVVLIWTRAIRYLWLIWLIGARVWEDGNMFVIKLMCVPLVVFTLFNALLIFDSLHKLNKFMSMHVGDDVADAVADVVSAQTMTRRMSSVDLPVTRRLSQATRRLSRAFSSVIDSNVVIKEESSVDTRDFQSADPHIKEE